MDRQRIDNKQPATSDQRPAPLQERNTRKATTRLFFTSEIQNPKSKIQNPTATSGWRPATGFTLLELIIVLAIITILLSVAIPTYQAIVYRARETVLKQNLYLMRHQIEEFAADQGRYPQSLQELVDRGYLKEIPLDPMTDSRETWQEVREETPALGTDNQPGIVNVRSGAEGESTEGTPYSEW